MSISYPQSYTQTYSTCNAQTHYLFAHSSITMGLRENLKALMDTAGENPHSLAAKTNVTQPTIFRILSGDSKDPRRSNIEKLARFFGLKAEDLYGRTQPKHMAAQEVAIYAVAKPSTATFTEEERLVIDGFRVADAKDKEQIIWLCQRALDNFAQPQGATIVRPRLRLVKG